MMNDDLEWTQSLGDAVVNQQADVMDAVQQVRARAQAAGNLADNAAAEGGADRPGHRDPLGEPRGDLRAPNTTRR